jgi:hypothetical protein
VPGFTATPLLSSRLGRFFMLGFGSNFYNFWSPYLMENRSNLLGSANGYEPIPMHVVNIYLFTVFGNENVSVLWVRVREFAALDDLYSHVFLLLLKDKRTGGGNSSGP